MKHKILKVLSDHFKQFNSYKLGKVADDIVKELQKDKINCNTCIYNETLQVMSVGPSNLCQKGREKYITNAELCPDYKEKIEGIEWKQKSIWELSSKKR